MEQLTMTIGGMSCGHCVKAVKQALARVEGVEVEEVTVGAARVSFDPARTRADLVTDAVRNAGYEPRPA